MRVGNIRVASQQHLRPSCSRSHSGPLRKATTSSSSSSGPLSQIPPTGLITGRSSPPTGQHHQRRHGRRSQSSLIRGCDGRDPRCAAVPIPQEIGPGIAGAAQDQPENDSIEKGGGGAQGAAEDGSVQVEEEVREAGHRSTQRHGAPPDGAAGDQAAVKLILTEIDAKMTGSAGGEEFDAEVAEIRSAVVNEVNEEEETSLMIAVEGGFLDVVVELLKYSARESIFRKNKSGFNALHSATKGGHRDEWRSCLIVVDDFGEIYFFNL